MCLGTKSPGWQAVRRVGGSSCKKIEMAAEGNALLRRRSHREKSVSKKRAGMVGRYLLRIANIA
jgi:hypothetical protein